MSKLGSIDLMWMTKRLSPFTGPSVRWGMEVQLWISGDTVTSYPIDLGQVWGMKLGITHVESPPKQ